MIDWSTITEACVLLLLGLSFVPQTIRSVKRLRHNGVPNDKVNALIIHLVVAAVAVVAMAAVGTFWFEKGQVAYSFYFVVIFGLTALLLALVGVLSLLTDEVNR